MAATLPAPWKWRPSPAPIRSPTQPKPSYKKHDWGYTVGGPVVLPGYNKNRDKTFFFWSQEWRRERTPNNFGPTNVPSDAERAGNFSDLCPDIYDPTNGSNDCPNVADPANVTIDP